MNADTTITIGAIGLFISMFITVFNFYDARKKRAKEEGVEQGIVSVKLDTILTEIKTINTKVTSLDTQLHEVSHKVKEHEGRIIVLEKKRRVTKTDVDE